MNSLKDCGVKHNITSCDARYSEFKSNPSLSIELHFGLSTVLKCWGYRVSVLSEFHTYSFDMLRDSGRIYAFRECICKVVVCSNLVNLDCATGYLVLQP